MRKTIPVGNAVFKYDNAIEPFLGKSFEYGGINREKDMARMKRMQKVTAAASYVCLAVLYLGVILIGLFLPLLFASAVMYLAYSLGIAKEEINKMAKIDCILDLIRGEGDVIFKMVCENSG